MIILDTHALIWSVDDNARLGKNTRTLIEESLERDTARHFDITLVSADQAILSYAAKGHVRAVDAAE